MRCRMKNRFIINGPEDARTALKDNFEFIYLLKFIFNRKLIN